MELHARLDGALGLDPTSGSSMDLSGPKGPGGQQGLRSVCPHSLLLLGAHWWAPGLSSMCVSPSLGRNGEMGLRRSWREVLSSQEASSRPPPSLTLPPSLPPTPVFSVSSCLCDFCAPGESPLPPLGDWHLLSQTGQSWMLQWGQKGDRFCPQHAQRQVWAGDTRLCTRRHVQECENGNKAKNKAKENQLEMSLRSVVVLKDFGGGVNLSPRELFGQGLLGEVISEAK